MCVFGVFMCVCVCARVCVCDDQVHVRAHHPHLHRALLGRQVAARCLAATTRRRSEATRESATNNAAVAEGKLAVARACVCAKRSKETENRQREEKNGKSSLWSVVHVGACERVTRTCVSKQQFLRAPTTPPRRTRDSWYCVNGSSRWQTQNKNKGKRGRKRVRA